MSVRLNNALKGLVNDQLEDMSLSDFCEATVLDPDGPIVQLEGNQGPLSAMAVMVPDYLKVYEVDIQDGELSTNVEGVVSGPLTLKNINGKLTIDNSLKAGDKVYIIRQAGAQKYLIVGRIK